MIEKGCLIAEACGMYGYSRQAYYKRKSCYKERERLKDEVIMFVQGKRKRQPEEGSKKLYRKFRAESETKIGRDRFLDVMRGAGLLLERKRRWARTTDSRHSFRMHKNLVKDLEQIEVGDVVAGDITYLDAENDFYYLSLLTEMRSRKIVGYALSENLQVEGCLKALEMAIKNMPKGFIHHSDRGIQYCCHAYVNRLKSVFARVSMTEENHVYENAMAERVNGILKQELGLDGRFRTIEEARQAVKEAVEIYNEERLHMSLDYKTPNEVFMANRGQWN